MAITITGNRFSNSIIGRPNVGNDIDLYEVNATPKYAVGFQFERADGNRFAYCQFNAVTSAAQLVSAKFADVTTALQSNMVIAPASAVAVAGDNITPGTKGSRYFEATIPNITANQLQGGYLVVNGGSGYGFTYRIKGNTSTGSPAAGNIRVQLYEPLVESLSATSDLLYFSCAYNDVKGAYAMTDCCPVGVTMAYVTTAAYYGWICTHGIVGCQQEGTLVAGNAITASAVSAGQVANYAGNGTANHVIGKALVNGGDQLIGLIWLDLA